MQAAARQKRDLGRVRVWMGRWSGGGAGGALQGLWRACRGMYDQGTGFQLGIVQDRDAMGSWCAAEGHWDAGWGETRGR